MIEPLEIPVDETREMLATVVTGCSLMICYASQAVLRRHGLI
jgi:hypothetical protein